MNQVSSTIYHKFYSSYNRSCEVIERKIQSYCPVVPSNSVKLILPSFAYSFSVSTLLSGGNIIIGFSSGILAIIAHVIHTMITAGIEKGHIFIKTRYETPKKTPKTQGHHYTYLLAVGTTLSIGKGIGLAINLKKTFYATVGLLLWEMASPHLKIKTPIMGIVAG